MSVTLINSPSINPENKVIGFSGSPRKNGNSDILLKKIISGVKQEKIPADYWNLTEIQFKDA
jgi:multimeric flavodoxin WrbA